VQFQLLVVIALPLIVIIILANLYADEKDLHYNTEKSLSILEEDYSILMGRVQQLTDSNSEKEHKIIKLMGEMDKLASLQPVIGIIDPDDIQLIIKQLTISSPFDSTFRITAGFGEGLGYEGTYRTSHQGTDMVPSGNWYIHPMWPGTVTDIGIHQYYGKYIVIQHAYNIRTKYYHLEKIFNTALPESEVKEDTIIGIMGSTGYSDGAHCHLQLEINDGTRWVPIDAKPFLRRVQ